jgi:outer membrane receptor protein involved in Fe transport
VDLELIEPVEKFSGGIDLNLITAAADAQGWFGAWSWVASARRSTIDKTISKFETDYGTPRFQDELLRITRTSAASQFTFGAMNSRDRVVVQERSEFGRSRDDFQSLWLRWQQDHTENVTSTWQLSSTTIEKSRQGRVDDPANSIGEILEQREFDTYELNTRWIWQIASTTRLDAGASYARQKADFNADFFAQYGALALPTLRNTSVLRDVEVDRSGESIQGYLSLTHQLTPRWTIETGLRFDGQDIDPVHVNELSARVHVDFKASERWRFALDVGRYTQQQHLYEIQIDNGKAELDEPQNSDQINLTSIFSPDDKARLRLDLYFRNIDDPWSHFENLYNQWVLIPELQGDRFEVQATKARVHGAELTLTYQVNDEFSWFVHTAHTQARETSLDKERPRPWQQEIIVKAGLSWQAPPWRVGVNAVYRSGLPTTALLELESEIVAELYRDELPEFVSLDAHVSRQIPVPRGRMEVYLDITNLTDRSNVGGYEYRLSDRRKPQAMLPMLPVLGLSWRW